MNQFLYAQFDTSLAGPLAVPPGMNRSKSEDSVFVYDADVPRTVLKTRKAAGKRHNDRLIDQGKTMSDIDLKSSSESGSFHLFSLSAHPSGY